MDDRSKIPISASYALGNTAPFQPHMPLEEAPTIYKRISFVRIGTILLDSVINMYMLFMSIKICQSTLNYIRIYISLCC